MKIKLISPNIKPVGSNIDKPNDFLASQNECLLGLSLISIQVQ